MRRLGDVPSDDLLVECATCRRRGRYKLARLIARHGEACDLADFLTIMRARCGVMPCHAQLVVPLRLDLDRPSSESNEFWIDIWSGDTTHEMRVGTVWHFRVAEAAMAAAVALWPHSIMTIRKGAQIMRTHNAADDRAREAQARIFKKIGLR